MSGEVFYGRIVRWSEGSRAAKGIVGRRTEDSWKFLLFFSNTLQETGRSQLRMPVLSRDREEDVPKSSGLEISRIFSGKIWFLGNGIPERRPLSTKLIIAQHFIQAAPEIEFLFNRPAPLHSGTKP